jgi:hypothetical protein
MAASRGARNASEIVILTCRMLHLLGPKRRLVALGEQKHNDGVDHAMLDFQVPSDTP